MSLRILNEDVDEAFRYAILELRKEVEAGDTNL